MSSARLSPSVTKKADESDRSQERAQRRASSRTEAAEEHSALAGIRENEFFQAVMNPDLKHEEREALVTSLMTTTLERTKDRERVKQLEAFREFLAYQVRDLAREVVAMTNLDSMTEIQEVIDQLTGDMVNFDKNMGPLLGIMDAIYQLRQDSLIEDAYRDIQDRAEFEAESEKKKDALRTEISKTQEDEEVLRRQNVELSQKRTWLGLAGPAHADRVAIVENETRLAALRQAANDKAAALKDLETNSGYVSKIDPKHEENVRKLRGLLDLTKEENRGQIVSLRDSALKFIDTADVRTSSLMKQFVSMSDQTDKVQDGNATMLNIYGVMHGGLQGAERKNNEIRGELAAFVGEETQIQKMARENKLRVVDSHISTVQNTAADTLATYSDLHQQAVRIQTMRDGITHQMDMARRLNTQGVAATADRMATSLTAFTSAALGEANMVAHDTLQSMRTRTNDITEKEIMRNAHLGQQTTDYLDMIVNEMEDMGEAVHRGTEFARQNMTQQKENMARLREQGQSLRQDLLRSIAVASETDEPEQDAAATPVTPIKLF